MDEEKNNSSIKPKVAINDLAEKTATEDPKPKKRVGLGIMLTILVLLLVGGALATGYLWGNNAVKSTAATETSNSTANSENIVQPENNKAETNDSKTVNEETEVKELVSQIYGMLKDKVERVGWLSKTYNNDGVYYKSEDMAVATVLDNSYGLNYNNGNTLLLHK